MGDHVGIPDVVLFVLMKYFSFWSHRDHSLTASVLVLMSGVAMGVLSSILFLAECFAKRTLTLTETLGAIDMVRVIVFMTLTILDGETIPTRSQHQCWIRTSIQPFIATMTPITSSCTQLLWIELLATLYVLSGVAQPLLMTVLTQHGLTDSSAQLYMVFYYIGPALVLPFTLHERWSAPMSTRLCAVGLAVFDLFATALNYAGINLAGPTVFAIIYSSVTVWTAIWARVFLKRRLSVWQWTAVCIVFGGLTLTATDTWNNNRTSHGASEEQHSSLEILAEETRNAAHWQSVLRGTLWIMIGSALHAGSYVGCEYILKGSHALTIPQNTGLLSIVAASAMILWQLLYTAPRWEELIVEPVQATNTTLTIAIVWLIIFGLANLLHAVTFFGTVKYYKGGSVMAGVLKGLVAVLVFGSTHFLYCGRTGGDEMCFTRGKGWSLLTVITGVVLFSYATPSNSPTAKGVVEEEASLLPNENVEVETRPPFRQHYTL